MILAELGPPVEKLRQVGVKVKVLPMAPRVRDLRRAEVTGGGFDLRSLPTLASHVNALRRRLRQPNPDPVHTNSLKAALCGGVAGRAAGIPVVWHIRDRIVDDYLPTQAVRLVRGAARVLPTAIVAISQATLATLPAAEVQVAVDAPVIPDAVP